MVSSILRPFPFKVQLSVLWSIRLVLLMLASPVVTFGQSYIISNGTDNTCVGAFLDSGGEGASGYGNNENYTYTLCPDAPGGAISLSFLTFNLSAAGAAPVDAMTIYDGNSTGAPLLGAWTGTALQSQVVSASAGNITGCLTVVFRSNNIGTGVFAAAITCYQPCSRPTAAATHGSATDKKICPGQSVTFNSSASTAAAGFNIASRRWDFGDGTVLNNAPVSVNHTYSQPGSYTAQLYLLDNNGCASTNRVDLVTTVGTIPDFDGTEGITGCSGETLCMDGIVNATTWNELPGDDLGSGVFLPDNLGECFSTTLTYTQFAPGQTMTNVNQLLSICVNMEHSYIGDLIINIISPTGQTVVLHQQGGGSTYLGIPVDNEATPNAQGVCWNYCWSPTANNGTWAANAGATLPSGTYQSVGALSGLLGSQLNGTWTFQVCDMYSWDNGFICDWGITFDPSLYQDLIEFTPVYGAACDSSYWSGPNITTTSANCNQICVSGLAVGDHPYVYTVTDNFGCTYDTTVMVTIVPDLLVNAGADVSTCVTPVQLNATIGSGGIPTGCDYTLWLYDSYGDGWTGQSYLTVTVDGVSTSWTLTGGTAGSTPITVSPGSTIVLNYQGIGLFSYEQSFALMNSAGVTVYSGSNPNNGNVWTGTATCPNGGLVYSWSPAAGLSSASIANPVATVSSTTEYCVTVYQQGHPDCPATDCVTITVDDPVDAGTNESITTCANGSSFSLFSELAGTPVAGGTWTGPTGAAHDDVFMPGTDASGIYTYTVTGTGACGTSTSTSTVTVIVNVPPSPGTDGTLTLCSSGAATGLFTALGGSPDAGGSWAGPSTVSGDQMDPATMSAGAYVYTVAGATPCPAETATVTVAINTPPNAGTDGALTLCSSGTAADLFVALGGSPDPGGVWSGPSDIIGVQFDPATMSAGDYVYTVNGTAPCPAESATVSIVINTPPTAGADGNITLCSSSSATSLFDQLGGTPDTGGTWSGPSAVSGGMIDPATMMPGDYVYTVSGIAPCPDETAMVSVTINTPPVPGADGALTLCSSGVAENLFAALGGTAHAGGTWTGPSAVTGGMIDPATMNAGDYVYTVNGTAPCPAESATVSVVINTPPTAGADGNITLCSTSSATSLFDQLGGTPDTGGTWSGPSAVSGGMIDPATMMPGDYVYTVAGIAPCPDETATV
ncbi:MAG: PKD domain-containing protein, partial [Flavobacteriales bacterium]